MSKYTSKVKYTTHFEGDKVRVTSTRLKRKDFLKLLPHIKVMQDLAPGSDDLEKIENLTSEIKVKIKPELLEKQTEFLELAADLLPKYITSITGLVDADGDAIPLESILSDAYFIELVGEMAGKLFDDSSTSEKETKNLDAPQLNDSTD